MVEFWANYAIENNIVLVLPQAVDFWMAKQLERFKDNVYSTESQGMKFMKAIVDKVKEPKDPGFNMSVRDYEFGTAYKDADFEIEDFFPGLTTRLVMSYEKVGEDGHETGKS